MFKSFLLISIFFAVSSFATDFVFNSFRANDLNLSRDARLHSSFIQLTNSAIRFSTGRAFYPQPILVSNKFSTSFVFSIRLQNTTTRGFGFAFVLVSTSIPITNLSGQHFGLFSNPTIPYTAPVFAVEFDTGRDRELNDTTRYHIGIDLNSAESVADREVGYYYYITEQFVPIDMRSGRNIRAWIELDRTNLGVNITVAPVEVDRPEKPLITFYNPVIANFVSSNMFVGFSASRTTGIEEQRILAWSLSDVGVAKDINTSNLPDLTLDVRNTSSSPLSSGVIVGIAIICIVVVILLLFGMYWFWLKKRGKVEDEEKIQDWELEYWPHRYSHEELSEATKGFSEDELLGSGGFGKVYKGMLPNNTAVAVKCINQDSKQGLREFMAEISSIGRLQHKNLVHMRGWCKKGQALMLVYDFMPNGSLSSWIFGKSRNHLCWETRRRVLMDVAEALNYLHHEWHELVLHRDIKSSNILLDSDMRGKLGDFGLAKLYENGQAPRTTRLVGTIGYMAPELVKSRATSASDVYSFGVLVLEVVSGRRPLEEEPILIEWVRELHTQGRLCEAVDARIAGEYEVDDMQMVLNMGLNCCNSDPQLRPTMKEVASMLINTHMQSSQNELISEVEPEPRFIAPAGGDNLEISTISIMLSLSPRT